MIQGGPSGVTMHTARCAWRQQWVLAPWHAASPSLIRGHTLAAIRRTPVLSKPPAEPCVCIPLSARLLPGTKASALPQISGACPCHLLQTCASTVRTHRCQALRL